MNKKDFISYLVDYINKHREEDEKATTKIAATAMFDKVFDAMTEAVCSGNEVAIPGFGKFKIAERGARTARNPRTDETVEVPAHKVLKFTPAKAVKEAVAEL